MSDNYDNHEDQTHTDPNSEESTMDDNQNQEDANGYEGLAFADEQATPEVDADALQALWLAAAQEAPTVEDLELFRLELQEAEEKIHAQTQEYKRALLQRARVFGRGEVADEMEISRKALATWETELEPEGDDLSGYYENLKKNQEREARRAERAAEKAAQEAASLQRLLDRVRNR